MARGDAIPDNLIKAYDFCRNIHKTHGRTYYLACKLLPAQKRPHVHALYGLTRYVDDIVDIVPEPELRIERLRAARTTFMAALDEGSPIPSSPKRQATGSEDSDTRRFVTQAAINTIATFSLDRNDFEAFFRSMEMDLTISHYQTYNDLLTYMAGSAAAIGCMLLPILGTPDPAAAREPARQLGLAFQLTNFIRDVDEDLDRGRIYLPLEDLAAHGVTPADLGTRQPTPALRTLIRHEIARAREHYGSAAAGIPLLDRTSQACVRAAYHAYGGILDQVVRANYDVFRRRATVPLSRKLAILATSLLAPAGRPVRRVPGAPR